MQVDFYTVCVAPSLIASSVPVGGLAAVACILSQVDLKKLMKRPPVVKMPSAAQVLTSQPFLKAIPDRLQSPLINGAKEFMKLRGSVLYTEGSTADGIWLIASGVIQVVLTLNWCRRSFWGLELSIHFIL